MSAFDAIKYKNEIINIEQYSVAERNPNQYRIGVQGDDFCVVVRSNLLASLWFLFKEYVLGWIKTDKESIEALKTKTTKKMEGSGFKVELKDGQLLLKSQETVAFETKYKNLQNLYKEAYNEKGKYQLRCNELGFSLQQSAEAIVRLENKLKNMPEDEKNAEINKLTEELNALKDHLKDPNSKKCQDIAKNYFKSNPKELKKFLEDIKFVPAYSAGF
jgi:hypothetical protein